MHINELEDIIEYRPKTFFLSTIIFLKFIHIFFIIIYFILQILRYTKAKNISFLQTAILLNNYIILLIFYILNWSLPFKYFFYFLIKLPYYNLFTFYNLNIFKNKIIANEIYNFIFFIIF